MGTPAAGHPQVEVICAEGTDGYPPGAPYDRILVTAGAWDVTSAWWQQLVVGGCIVVPLRTSFRPEPPSTDQTPA